jgi:hypothetical protein
MGMTINPDGTVSPASKAFDEAIDLAIEGRSPYPDRARFIDSDSPFLECRIDEAFESGKAAVVVSPDGSFQVLPAPDPTKSPSLPLY